MEIVVEIIFELFGDLLFERLERASIVRKIIACTLTLLFTVGIVAVAVGCFFDGETVFGLLAAAAALIMLLFTISIFRKCFK